MKEDFLKELEYLGFTARIKRISDALIYNSRELYKAMDLGIEPNWHLIFLALKKEEKLSVTELAEMLHLSHQAIVKIANKMKSGGYIASIPSRDDSRKQLLYLTEKSLEEFPKYEKEWNNIKSIIEDLVSPEFFHNIQSFEEKIAKESFAERYLKLISKQE